MKEPIVKYNACGQQYVESVAFTHHPMYPGIWVDLGDGWRLKEFYDIELEDGTRHLHCYPNGQGWGNFDGRWDETEVAKVRLIPESENPWRLRSGIREQSEVMKRAVEMFGKDTVWPEVVEKDGEITFIPRKYRWFGDGVEAPDGTMKMHFWEGELTKAEAEANGNTESSKHPG